VDLGEPVVTATARLLWASCHRRPQAAAVLDALEAGADVPTAVSAAAVHRLPGLLWRALEEAGALEALREYRDVLGQLVEVHLLQELVLLPHALALAVTPLTELGLEPVVLKGPAVAARYPSPGLRTFDDIDLLLPYAQHDAAVGALRSAGWELVRKSARDHYDTVLRHPEGTGLLLELHHGLEAWYDRASALKAGDLWARRVSHELNGVRCFTLPLAEELVMLCAHAAKPFHCFSRLVWIADLAMLLGFAVETSVDVDWDRVRACAVDGRCMTAVAAALGLARHAGAVSPAEMFPLPSRGWRAAAISRLVDERWPLVSANQPTFHLRFALADGSARRVLLLLGSTHGMRPLDAVSRQVRSIGQAARRWWALRSQEQVAEGVAAGQHGLR
jgi:hypothetical protein